MRGDGAAPRGLWPPAGGRLCPHRGKRLTTFCASLHSFKMCSLCIASAQGTGRKVLKMDRPAAGGFLSLTAFQAEGYGGGFAANYKKGRGWRRELCRRVVHPTGKMTHYILCVAFAQEAMSFICPILRYPGRSIPVWQSDGWGQRQTAVSRQRSAVFTSPRIH